MAFISEAHLDSLQLALATRHKFSNAARSALAISHVLDRAEGELKYDSYFRQQIVVLLQSKISEDLRGNNECSHSDFRVLDGLIHNPLNSSDRKRLVVDVLTPQFVGQLALQSFKRRDSYPAAPEDVQQYVVLLNQLRKRELDDAFKAAESEVVKICGVFVSLSTPKTFRDSSLHYLAVHIGPDQIQTYSGNEKQAVPSWRMARETLIATIALLEDAVHSMGPPFDGARSRLIEHAMSGSKSSLSVKK